MIRTSFFSLIVLMFFSAAYFHDFTHGFHSTPEEKSEISGNQKFSQFLIKNISHKIFHEETCNCPLTYISILIDAEQINLPAKSSFVTSPKTPTEFLFPEEIEQPPES